MMIVEAPCPQPTSATLAPLRELLLHALDSAGIHSATR